MLELKTADLDDYEYYESPMTVTPGHEIKLFSSQDPAATYKIMFTLPSEKDVVPRTNEIGMSVDASEIKEVILSVVDDDGKWTKIDSKVPHLSS